MNKKQLQQMIEMLVESVLIQEKDDAPKTSGIDLSGDTASAPDDSSSDAGADAGSTDTTDAGASDGAPDSGSDAGDLSGDVDGLDPAAGDTTDVDSGGSSGGGGFSGGGGGFGGGGGGFDSGSSDDSSTDSADADLNDDGSGNSDVVGDSMPLDPIQDTIDMAVSLSKEIGDHQIILNVIKSKMQKYFPDFDDAIPIIQGLWDTNDPNLKIVARKLIMFIKGD